MPKLMLALGDTTLKMLENEAEDRGISIQELIRAVIVPEWARLNVKREGSERSSDYTYKSRTNPFNNTGGKS